MAIDRYKDIKKLINSDNKHYYLNPIYPDLPETEEDIYVITTGGDRYDTLAQQFYNDSSLWWAIASANTSVRDNLIVEPGIQLRIPLSKQRVLQLYKSANSSR
tara:strand:- start:179 stop:487 length:309 start_codon:yes stop_codon:yes gene_type:complete